MAFNDIASDWSTAKKIVEKLNLPTLENYHKRDVVMRLLQHCDFDLESSETIYSQYINIITNVIKKEVNERKNSKDVYFNLTNTINNVETLEEDFIGSTEIFQLLTNELNEVLQSMHYLKKKSENSSEGSSVDDGSSDYSELLTELNDVKSLIATSKNLIKEAEESNEKLKMLQSKLERYRALPADPLQINQKILEAQKVYENLKKDTLDASE